MTSPVPDPKPGIKTTEFWSTLSVHVVTVLATVLDLLHQHKSASYTATQPGVGTAHTTTSLTTLQALIPIVAFIASGVVQLGYVKSRTVLKAGHAVGTGMNILNHVEAEADALKPVVAELSPSLSSRFDRLLDAVEGVTKKAEPVVAEAVAAVVPVAVVADVVPLAQDPVVDGPVVAPEAAGDPDAAAPAA